ncbi:MAG: response regulator transcription factor [Symbiobacteriaceae bacterium]|nr:response regulator transcription factor [Symbiobacteriaceae bacterium]
MRLLLVEDEHYLAKALVEVLKKNKYTTDLAEDGEYALDCALSGVYDVIILDIMLPKKDGLAVLKELRRQGIATPVLLLTARDGMEDKVRGLDLGADDYLAKPFHTEELLARVRALSRRPGAMNSEGTLSYNDITLNPHNLLLQGDMGAVQLTLKEAQLLELLLHQPRAIVSKESMIEKVWGYDSHAEDNHVEAQISALRRKMQDASDQTKIRTLRGAGYMLT